MLIRNIKEFKKKTNKKKIICLDYGRKRVGVAISDESQKISIPMKILFNNSKLNEEIKCLIVDFNIGGVLVGLPLQVNKNRMSQSIFDKIKNINFFLENNGINLPFFFWDESYTSIEAEDITNMFFKNKKEQKKKLDKFAAKVILEDFINFNTNNNEKDNQTTS